MDNNTTTTTTTQATQEPAATPASNIIDQVNVTPATQEPTSNNISEPTQVSTLLDQVNTNASAPIDTPPPDANTITAEPTAIEVNEQTIANYAKEANFADLEKISVGKDLGDVEQFVDMDALKNLTPAIMKMGIPAEKAKDVFALVAAYESTQLSAYNKMAVESINQRAEESRKEFGSDLADMCRMAEDGGSAIFDESLWKELKATPILVNDKRFIRALARVGRMVKTDTGTKASSTGDALGGQWSAAHWIKSSAKYGTK